MTFGVQRRRGTRAVAPASRVADAHTIAGESHEIGMTMDRIPDIDRRKRANGSMRSTACSSRRPDRAHFTEQLIDKARRRVPTCRFRRTPRTSTRFRSSSRCIPGDQNSSTDPLITRWNAMAMVAREQAYERRRSHRELRPRDAYDAGFQPFLTRRHGKPWRRYRVRPGPSSPGVYSRVPARPSPRSSSTIPPGSRRTRHLVVSASVADARLLAVPDGVDGLAR